MDEYFPQECIHLKKLLNSEIKLESPLDLVQALYENKLISSFPNINICLRIFFSIMVTNASGERSFSTLKRVKTYLRNSIAQENLNSLAIVSINKDILDEIDTNCIIEKFASLKARKRFFK